MQTLSYGIQKPQTGDKGSVFFPALEDNLDQQNDHDHDGVDSAKIPSSSVTAVTLSVSSAGWLASGTGYRQLLTCPGTMVYTDKMIIFRNQAAGKQVFFLCTEEVSSNTFYVYCNDNTVSLTAYFI